MIASHLVLDGFLGEAGAEALLEFALANEHRFTSAEVSKDGEHSYNPAAREALHIARCRDAELDPFRARVKARFDEICTGVGIEPFVLDHLELSVAVHLDGGHFVSHADTFSGKNREKSDRVVSLVYYFHRQPRGFSGGELVLHSFTGDGSCVIAPEHDRLVAFPSFAVHEVRRISVPSNGFADGRFAVVCWFHRARG